MTTNQHPTPLLDSRLTHYLLVWALLQAWIAGCALWALGLFLAVAQSDLLRDLVAVSTAVVTVILRVTLHLLGV